MFVCDLPDSGRHVIRPNQGLSTGRRENLGTRVVISCNVSQFAREGFGIWHFRWTLPFLRFERERMQLVYENILFNTILIKHLLSEHLQ